MRDSTLDHRTPALKEKCQWDWWKLEIFYGCLGLEWWVHWAFDEIFCSLWNFIYHIESWRRQILLKYLLHTWTKCWTDSNSIPYIFLSLNFEISAKNFTPSEKSLIIYHKITSTNFLMNKLRILIDLRPFFWRDERGKFNYKVTKIKLQFFIIFVKLIRIFLIKMC